MIDETARISSKAIIGKNVSIGPWTIVGPDVVVGEGSEIGSHVVLKGPTVLGSNVKVFQFSTVGEGTPALAYDGESTSLEIGEGTVIREGVTIHRGTMGRGTGRTIVGKNCLLMAYVHIGHDCILGDKVIMANNASVAGHVVVGDYANFGGYSGVPQFRSIGENTHIAAMSLVTKDVPAFMTVAGNPASAVGLNLEGMRRRDFSADALAALKESHKIVYRSGLTKNKALNQLAELRSKYSEVEKFARSIESSESGIVRGRSH